MCHIISRNNILFICSKIYWRLLNIFIKYIIIFYFINNIFFKNSPLHDGAMIISRKRIRAAGCILPVSHDHDIPKELGLRHRAALGVSQDTDAVAIVVSEETGRISVAMNGEFRLRLSGEELESLLTKEMSEI